MLRVCAKAGEASRKPKAGEVAPKRRGRTAGAEAGEATRKQKAGEAAP